VRRRSFLKVVGLASLGASLPWAASAVSAARRSSGAIAAPAAAPIRQLYRGLGGAIYASSNAGRSWKLHTYLGPEFDVTHVRTDDAGGTRLRVAYRGQSFSLTLAPNLRSWLTA
jgi:hypothetical protein